MPLQSSTIVRWATANLGWNGTDPGTDPAGVPLFPGPYVQKMPDRIGILTSTSGPGYVLDGAADHTMFQARFRGLGSPDDLVSYADAEAIAFAFDAAVFGAQFPVTVDGKVIAKIFRDGGQPSPLGSSPDNGQRYEFTCNYFCVIGA